MGTGEESFRLSKHGTVFLVVVWGLFPFGNIG